MEEFFDNGTLAPDHLRDGLRDAIRERRVFPMLCSAAHANIGSDLVLDFIADFLPSAADRGPVSGVAKAGSQEQLTRKVADTEPLSLYVFKTAVDPFAGRISYFKVWSGVLKNDATIVNFNRD